MACCALAAFIISQIILRLDWLREQLGLAPPVEPPNRVVAWRLGQPAPIPSTPSRPALRRLGLTALGGSLMFAVLAALSFLPGSPIDGGLICRTALSPALQGITP